LAVAEITTHRYLMRRFPASPEFAIPCKQRQFVEFRVFSPLQTLTILRE